MHFFLLFNTVNVLFKKIKFKDSDLLPFKWSCFLQVADVVFSPSVCDLHLETRWISFSFCFKYKEIGVKAGYQILSWGESQTQVFHAWSTIISYLPRSNVLWWQTLELLSQTCFLLLPSGSYGYDRNCWFQYMMIINIKINFPLPVWALCPKS